MKTRKKKKKKKIKKITKIRNIIIYNGATRPPKGRGCTGTFKPENILLLEGEAMLADFGIALAVKEAGGNRLTETGLSLGTPQYMSPEQATGDRQLDARSDLYSLAAVLYEMLAGEPPVTGPTAQAMIAKLMTERPTHLRVLRGSVPEAIDAAVAKALDKTLQIGSPAPAEFARALDAKPVAATVAIPAPARSAAW